MCHAMPIVSGFGASVASATIGDGRDDEEWTVCLPSISYAAQNSREIRGVRTLIAICMPGRTERAAAQHGHADLGHGRQGPHVGAPGGGGGGGGGGRFGALRSSTAKEEKWGRAAQRGLDPADGPAVSVLTPHGLISRRGFCSRSMAARHRGERGQKRFKKGWLKIGTVPPPAT